MKMASERQRIHDRGSREDDTTVLRNVPDRVVMTLPVDYRLIIVMKKIRPVLDVTRTG
jgi:hypothetical protein